MENRKNINRKMALGIAAGVFLTLTLSFMAGNRPVADEPESVDIFYGRTVFGGEFTWLDNVKRPGLSAAFSNSGGLTFDFSTRNVMPDTFVDPSQNLIFIASPSSLSNNSEYNGPFENEHGLDSLFAIEQVSPDAYLSNFDNGSGGGGDNRNSYASSVAANIYNTDFNEDDDNTDDIGDGDNIDDVVESAAVVPVPSAALLAAIGVMAVSAIKKK
jgi:hypothetical protein